MHLESIQLTGFRTFAEPTTIELDPGLTSLVGPTGCGKTTVLDAIRWALSTDPNDQRFKGSEAHPPATAASVTLNFLDGDMRNRLTRTFDQQGGNTELQPDDLDRDELASCIHFIDSTDKPTPDSRQIFVSNRPESGVAESDLDFLGIKLAQLSQEHQVIVVTDSKKMMLSSDKIIGVTMIEYGVSSLMA